MNSLLVLALACAATLGSVSAFQYGAPPDRERNGLIGPVWLVTENGDHGLRKTSIYDRKGHLIREEVNTGHGWQMKMAQSLLNVFHFRPRGTPFLRLLYEKRLNRHNQ